MGIPRSIARLLSRRCVGCGVMLVALCAASAAKCEEPAVEWARQHAIPLETVEAGHGFRDMQPLKQVVGRARIVELGEATHGTREFFQLKHRMVEFLASQMGFTIFSIEANMPEAYRLNEYVLNGVGDPKELLKGMYFWTWNTQEVLEMIQWMREYNKSGAGRMEFTGFDMQTPTMPLETVSGFVRKYEPDYAGTQESAWKEVRSIGPPASGTLGVGTATFPVSVAAGHRIRLSGYIKTEKISTGYAGLWWRVDGEPGHPLLAFDNMNDRGAKGTTPWTRYELSLDVPKEARNINFGVIHTGNGEAWFDSLQVEIDGTPYTDTSAFDLDFESPTPRGFYAGGSGYAVGIDARTAHSGKQSLHSRFLGVRTDPKLAAQDCEAVVARLRADRSKFLSAGASVRETDWAIQNARLVLQYAELEDGEKTRDESMAENLKWIAEQNPKARIVVWAHNAHVGYGEYGGRASMGSYLRKTFGAEVMNFGFAFNEGAFQSMDMGASGMLRAFTVGPAPEGSLDRTLAATGIPLFALDLRRTPKEGPVGEWFRQPHLSRSIGAGYSDALAPKLWSNNPVPEDYDAILFVEKTAAARPN